MCKCSAPTGSATGTHVNFPPLCAQPPLSGWAAQVVAASRLGREDLPGLHAIFQHLDAGGCPAAAPICMHALAAVCAGYVSSAGMNGAASGQEQLPATCGRACFRFAACASGATWQASACNRAACVVSLQSTCALLLATCHRQVGHFDRRGAASWAAAAGQVGDRRKPGVKSGVWPTCCGKIAQKCWPAMRSHTGCCHPFARAPTVPSPPILRPG